ENSVKNVHNRYTETQLDYLKRKKRITAYCKVPVFDGRIDYYTYKRDFKVNEEEDVEESEVEEEPIKKAANHQRVANWVKSVSKSTSIGSIDNNNYPSPKPTYPAKGSDVIDSGNHSQSGKSCQLGSNWKMQRKQKIKQMRLKAMNKKLAEKALAIWQGP
ncbi:13881_t:CDS:2, partial [Ambispora leptoticha]